MNYRYYIYKQNNLTADFNKYDLSDYALLREIKQNSQWGLKIERDNEFFTVIRRKFNGAITVKGSDYNALIALENTHIQYAIVIHRECNGTYSEFWKGFFSYFDFRVDSDRCYLSFEPEPWDVYTPIFDQMDVERNVLAADSDWIMRFYPTEFPSETKTVTYPISHGVDGVASWQEWIVGTKFFLYSSESTWLYYDPDWPGDVYSIVRIYKRDYGYSDSNTVGPTGDAEWVLDPAYTGEYSPGIYRWVRPYMSLDSEPVKTYSYVTNGMNLNQVLEATVPSGDYKLLKGLKRLSYILQFFADTFSLTYQSHFFNDSPCPMGGHSLDWTMVQQISNLRDTTDEATRGMMKLKDLLAWIRDTFNVYWYIDANGDFRLEHRKYFDFGLSYAYTHVIELDLATSYPSNILHLNRYEYSKPDLFRFEKLEFQYSYFDDWTEGVIEYPQLSISGNSEQVKTVAWGSDITGMYDSRSELPKIGWVLLNTELINGFYQVVSTVGAISGSATQNARFSSANLLRDLWTYGRLLPTGNVNGVATTFGSVDRLKKQTELSFPMCCTDIDFNGLFRTGLGDGQIESADYEAKSGNLKVNLTYE